MQAPHTVPWLWWAASELGCVTPSSTLLTRMATDKLERPLVSSPSHIGTLHGWKAVKSRAIVETLSHRHRRGKGCSARRWHSVGQTAWSPALGDQLHANCLTLTFMPLTDPIVPAATWPSIQLCPIPNIFSSPPKLPRTTGSNKHRQSTEFQAPICAALMTARWQWKVACCHPHCELCCLATHGVNFLWVRERCG